MFAYRYVWREIHRPLCVCRAPTSDYDVVHSFRRSAGSFVALQAALEGNLCPAVASCGGQVVSASAQPFCSAPEMLSLTLLPTPQLCKTPAHLAQSGSCLNPSLVAWCGCCAAVLGKTGAVVQPCMAGTVLLGHGTWDTLLVILNGCGGRGGSPSQSYFSQFPIDGSRGLLFLQLQFGGTEQTLSKQGISVQRREHDALQSLFCSLLLRTVKKPKISGLDGQPCCGGGCCGWMGLR